MESEETIETERTARDAKLFARLQALCQLEAMLASCLAAAARSVTLPSLAQPLMQLDSRSAQVLNTHHSDGAVFEVPSSAFLIKAHQAYE